MEEKQMKLRNIACLIVAVMMMATLAISASAATLKHRVYFHKTAEDQTNPKAGTVVEAPTAEDLGAAYAHHVAVLNRYNDGRENDEVILTIDPNNRVSGKRDLNVVGSTAGADMPYVTYKVSADDAKYVSELAMRIHGHLNNFAGGNYYQLGVYVTSSFTPAEDGSYDFSELTPAHVFGGTEDAPASDLTNSNGWVELSLDDAVTSLGEAKDVYVTLVFNQNWFPNNNERFCVFKLYLDAVQADATVVNPPVEDGEGEGEGEGEGNNTQNPDTSDVAVISALSLALISGVAIVATRKKAR
jgi:hypothetical protein